MSNQRVLCRGDTISTNNRYLWNIEAEGMRLTGRGSAVQMGKYGQFLSAPYNVVNPRKGQWGWLPHE